MGFGWKLTISFALLFVIGAFCGATITLTVGSLHQFTAKTPGPVTWEQAAMKNLTRQLDLTPEQQEKVRVPIHDAIEKLRAVRQRTLQETNEAFDETLGELAPLLTQEQQKKLDEFRARRMARVRAALAKPSP
jgi:flagellar motility protein MotE (MotC chaperone)